MPRNFATGAFDFKAQRKLRGVSQQAAAALLHTTQPSISRWEADGTMPNIYRMAWLLHWQIEDMSNAADTTASKSARKSHAAKRAKKSVAKATARSGEDIQRGTSENVSDDAGTV